MPENLANHLPAPLTLDLIATLPCAPAAYVLLGRNGRRYTGAARDLRERMRDHHAGGAERTKNQRPLLLLHHEPLPTYADALRRERFLKSGQGRQFLDAQQTVPPEALLYGHMMHWLTWTRFAMVSPVCKPCTGSAWIARERELAHKAAQLTETDLEAWLSGAKEVNS